MTAEFQAQLKAWKAPRGLARDIWINIERACMRIDLRLPADTRPITFVMIGFPNGEDPDITDVYAALETAVQNIDPAEYVQASGLKIAPEAD